MERYARLKKEWLLRGWTDMPRALVNYFNSDIHELNQNEYYVAESCDGGTNFLSLAFLPYHHAILDRFINNNIVDECNRGDFIDEVQKYRAAHNPRLTRVLWFITGKCNLQCRHCCMDAPSSKYGDLSFEALSCLIDQFENANVIQVGLSGGEPFFRDDLEDIFNLLAQKRIGLHQIYSNGTLITDEILDVIKSHSFKPIFQISYDGMGTHDEMRGVYGIEQKVIESIKRIKAFDFPIGIGTSIDRTNIHCLEKTYCLLKELGIQSWTINPPRAAGRWKKANTALTIEEQIAPFESLLNLWLGDGQPFYVQMSGFLFGLYGILESQLEAMPHGEFMKEPPDIGPEDYVCESCRERPSLLPNGILIPCPVYVDTIVEKEMPNLLHEDLSNAWARSSIRTLLDLRRADLLEHNPECRVCAWFNRCGGGCRALAITETNNLMERDPVTCSLWQDGHIEYFRALAKK